MFKWLKEKTTKAVATQCKFNIRLSTKKLVSVANRADQHINASGGNTDGNDIRDVESAQKKLLSDVILGNSKGMSFKTIYSDVIAPLLHKVKATDRAKNAVDHVINSAAKTIVGLNRK